jgi:DNA polymerase-3 subunit gamma/tau
MVYYRKYRPQTIKELDSEDVRVKLNAVLATAAPTFLQVPHAFLFTGPKGLGKTSTARIVAKVINCTGRKDTSGKDIEPCNTCEMCVSITNGTNMDILEIDAASNRGIDEMRDLKEKIRLAPLSAKKKVYIIDEVHMLTTEAFNALLKTLEEPPAHAVFILCTTEAHKVPATILSRCFHINFRLATEDELIRSFKRIVKGEKLEIDEKTLRAIARLADGGFRDGTKILEELVALSGGKTITEELLEGKYQVQTVSQHIEKLLSQLAKKDVSASLQTVAEVVSAGVDAKYFLTELLDRLHQLLLSKVGVGTPDSKAVTLSLEDLRSLLSLLSKAAGESKYAVLPQLPLELAIVTWCEGAAIVSTSQASINSQVQKVVEKKAEEVTVATLRKQVGNIAKVKALYGESDDTKKPREKTDPAEVSILKYSATGDQSPEWVDALWKNIINQMKEHNHMIAGVLRSCKIHSYDRQSLVIEALSSFHKERLDEAKTHTVLEQVCTQLVGNPIAVTVQLKSN